MKVSTSLAYAVAALMGLNHGVAFAQSVRKPVVAVTHMKDIARTGQGPALETMIQTSITQTGKFRVIERDFGELDSEQALARSGKVTTNTPGRTGGYEGVDFIVYGTITSASGGRQSDEGGNVGRAIFGHMIGVGLGGDCKKTVSTLAVDIKIVEHNTGEVKFAKQLTQRAASKTSCSGDSSLDLTSLLRDVANQTAMGLTTTMYPMKVAGVQGDGTFVLNYGEGALTPGLTLAVLGQGQGAGFVDPDTGVKLVSDETLLGLIRVSEVETRFSKAVPVSTFAAPPPAGSIVREATPDDIARFAKGKGKKR